jgi:hypothetical protein
LKLVFLIVSRALSLLGLSRRQAWRKDAGILMLCHQLAVGGGERARARARPRWPGRALPALLAGTLPASPLAAVRLILTPGTVLRWHRDIVGRRWSRPAAHRKVRPLLRRARQNQSRGYRRIGGGLAGPGITVTPSPVWQILKNAGVDPAAGREGPGRAGFPRSRAQRILAADLFTAGLLNGTKACVLAVTEHGTRRIRVLGATGHPAAVGGQRGLDGVLIRLAVVFGHHQQPAGLARFHPPGTLPLAGKKACPELTAQAEVALELADPAGQAAGIGESRSQVVDTGVEAILRAHDALAIG